jgi:hypothetical protein
VDSRLRRSPPDRASAVPYGQAGENAMRFPRLAHKSAAAHKLHSTPQQDRMNLISGKGETSSRLPALAYSSPEAVQTTGTVACALIAWAAGVMSMKICFNRIEWPPFCERAPSRIASERACAASDVSSAASP